LSSQISGTLFLVTEALSTGERAKPKASAKPKRKPRR
jgi:hypothetical protein